MNIYKKMAQQCVGLTLDKSNCNFVSAYNVVRKYAMSEVRAISQDLAVPLVLNAVTNPKHSESLLELLLSLK